MTEPPGKDALEDVLRPDEVPEDLVLLLRAGEEDDDVELLERQALRQPQPDKASGRMHGS